MSTEVALGQDQNARRPVRLKLVKSSVHNGKPALFSDSIHNSLEVVNTRDPNAIDMTYEVAETLRVSGRKMFHFPHTHLGVAYFICN
jgi:hypothetical protein